MKAFLIASLFVLAPLLASAEEIWPSESVYQLRSVWRDQNNQETRLSRFAGQPVIVAMVYTKCAHACPMTITKIQEIEQRAKKMKLDNFKIVLASFDYAKDTPEHLKPYMAGRKLDKAKWTLLASGRDAIARELAVVLGINYKALPEGEYSHSNIISLLNAKGVRVAKIESLTADIAPIVNALKTLN